MSREKKLFPTTNYRVYSPEDLSRNWFVYWYEGRQRIRKYGRINHGDTYQKRMDLAKALIRKLKAEHRPKISVSEQTVWSYLETNKHIWKKKTQEQYFSVANVFFDFMAGREVNVLLIKEFLQGIRNTRHTTTYNKYRSSLKRLFAAVGAAYLFDEIKPVKTIKTPARYFQPYQAERLAKVIQEKDQELWMFVQFVYYCFIRPGELRFLQVGDLLLEEREIRMPGDKTKNKKTEFVAVPDVFAPQLEQYYNYPPGAYLFPSPHDDNKPIGKSTMYRRHKKILKSMHFGKGYSLYSWKHTGAVAAAKAGVGMKELQIQLRHHSLDQTDEYLRQMGVRDVHRIRNIFPKIGARSKGYRQLRPVASESGL